MNMLSPPAISIVVPVYNPPRIEGRSALRRCLDSIKAQTFADFEGIVVIDASPDDSLAVAEEYSGDDARFTIIVNEANRNLYDTRLRGFLAAKGEFVCTCDADDWLPENALDALYGAITRENADIAHGFTTAFSSGRNNGIFRYSDPFEKSAGKQYVHAFLAAKRGWSACAKLVRRTVFESVADRLPRDMNWFLGEDILFSAVIGCAAEKYIPVDAIVYHYEITVRPEGYFPESEKGLKDIRDACECLAFIKAYIESEDGLSELRDPLAVVEEYFFVMMFPRKGSGEWRRKMLDVWVRNMGGYQLDRRLFLSKSLGMTSVRRIMEAERKALPGSWEEIEVAEGIPPEGTMRRRFAAWMRRLATWPMKRMAHRAVDPAKAACKHMKNGNIAVSFKAQPRCWGFARMYTFIKPYRWPVVLAIALTSLAGTTDAMVAWAIRPYLDVAFLGRESAGLRGLFPLLIIVFTVGQGLLKQGAVYFSLMVNGRIVADIKAHMFGSLLRNEPAFFEAATSGSVLAMYNHDVEAACAGVFVNGKALLLRLITSLSLIFVLFHNSWILATVALTALLVAIYPLTRLRKSIRQMEQQGHLVQTDLLTAFNEGYHGHRVIAAYGLSARLCGKLRSIMAGYNAFALNLARRTSGLYIFMHLMIALGIAGAVWLQGHLIAAGRLTPGAFVSFLTALLLLYNPLKGLSGTFNAMVGNRLALERLVDNLGREPAIRNSPSARKMAPFSSEIRYENVSFAYRADVPVLRDVSLSIRKGEKVALVGESGGGKTTLCSLLPRFYDPHSGRVTIDGVDIRDLELASLRESLALVFQDNFLFEGTIRENILLGRLEAGDREIDAAVDAACLRGFVSSLPLGLDTRIGERGIRLSGGEKQRVAIARAFIRNAPIVILDEATSSLDNESEAVVQQAIENIERDKTILIIAHRLSTIVHADRIMVLRDGAIAESGTHSELMLIPGGRYAGLYHS